MKKINEKMENFCREVDILRLKNSISKKKECIGKAQEQIEQQETRPINVKTGQLIKLEKREERIRKNRTQHERHVGQYQAF